MEHFLAKLVPGIEVGWEGASAAEIAEIETLAGRPLPNFYRWFLTRMGRDMGALSFASLDFSAARVLSCYREEIEHPSPRYLLIGYETDPVVPMHTWYDLDRPNRDDALVLSQGIGDPLVQLEFETLREMLAWKAMLNFRVDALPYSCKGSFEAAGGDVRAQLETVIDRLGFEQPIATGAFCGVFDRSDAAMICSISPRDAAEEIVFFRLAGDNAGALRRILGIIAKEADLKVEVEA